MIPDDGEGATHLITIDVEGARDREEARTIARAVADSPLVKTAVAGPTPTGAESSRPQAIPGWSSTSVSSPLAQRYATLP